MPLLHADPRLRFGAAEFCWYPRCLLESLRHPKHRALWLTLFLVAAVPRFLGAFFLPNAFGDAYVYIRVIGDWSVKLSSGTFVWTDLYGYWLPLYQFLCAVINVFVGNGFYSGKVVSALFGVGVCLLVYPITLRLTSHRTAALLAFALIALNPLHIVNSASAMTDVPHAFFVLASLYFVLSSRWVPAASLAALAGLTRADSWMFIALIPLIQFFKERRVSPAALVILLMPPVFWLLVSWKATGNWLATFEARKHYMDWLLSVNPSLGHFTLSRILRDGRALVTSTDPAVMATSFVGAWSCVKYIFGTPKHKSETISDAVTTGVYFFAFLGFLILAYVTHKQPIIFDRYGLILFSLGIPLMAWTVLDVTRRKPHLKRRLLTTIVVVCALNAGVQFVSAVGFLNQYSAQRAIADYLRDHFRTDANSRIFCDEGKVLALSGIPPEKFLTSSDAPRDRESFLTFLKERNVEYLVFINKNDSTATQLFPELIDGEGNDVFQPLVHARARFLPTEIWVYRVQWVSNQPSSQHI